MMIGNMPTYVESKLEMAVAAVNEVMIQNTSNTKSSGKNDLYTLVAITFLNYHLMYHAKVPTIQWHPSYDIDAKLKPIRKDRVKVIWVNNGGTREPATVIKDEHRAKRYIEYLKTFEQGREDKWYVQAPATTEGDLSLHKLEEALFHYPAKEVSKKPAPQSQKKKQKKLAACKTASKVKSPTRKRPRSNEESEMTRKLRSRNKPNSKEDDLASHNESDGSNDSN